MATSETGKRAKAATTPKPKPNAGYERGDLKITLHGKRLHGAFVLRRMKRPGRPQWLLMKRDYAFADPSRDTVADVTTSVASRRTMESIGKGERVWSAKG